MPNTLVMVTNLHLVHVGDSCELLQELVDSLEIPETRQLSHKTHQYWREDEVARRLSGQISNDIVSKKVGGLIRGGSTNNFTTLYNYNTPGGSK